MRALQFLRPSYVGLCILVLLLACQRTPNADSPTIDQLPNIIIIFADDQGYQDLACFGSPDIQTPHIDRLANQGVKFTQFYAAQGVCSASRAALMTGCYPNRLGIHGAYFPNSKRGLNPSETTIAEMLKPLGYATAIFGKWHLGDHPMFNPTRHGFDEFFGIPFSNDMWPLHPQNDYFNFDPLPLMENDSVIQYLEDQSMLTTQITERAVSFIDRNKDQPFFLYLPHPMPHVPLYVSDKFKGKSERGLYGDVIMEMDWSTGQIVEALEQHGIRENTLIIFTSDNGPWLNYGEHSGSALPLREGKGTALEGGVRVPCVMNWPGKIPAGLVQTEPAMAIDILPTIAGITQATLPEHKIDGMDILPLIKGEDNAKSPQEAYYFYYKTNELHGVLSENWKLYFPHEYRSLNGREGGKGGLPVPYDQNKMSQELYNLETDVSETVNVAAQHPEVVERLLDLAEKARNDLGDKLTDREGLGVREVGLVTE